jgi:hypothetical protein
MGKPLVIYTSASCGPYRSASAYVANHQDMFGVQRTSCVRC